MNKNRGMRNLRTNRWLRLFIISGAFFLLETHLYALPFFNNPDKKIEKAYEYLSSGQFDKAEAETSEIIQKHPDYWNAYSVKIRALVAQKKYSAASQVYKDLFKLKRSDDLPALVGLAWGIIIEALHDKSFFVRGQAALSLGEIGDPHMLIPLKMLLSDSYDIVKVHAAQAMGTLQSADAIPILRELIQSKNYLVRLAAASSMAKLGEKRALGIAVQDLDDKSWNVRARAAEILGESESSTAIPYLRKKLRDDSSYVRVRVAEALARCGDKSVDEIFSDTAQEGEWPDRIRASESLLILGNKDLAFKTFQQALSQKDWKIRMQAAEAIGRAKVRDGITLLEPYEKDPRWEVQMAVAKSLLKLGDSSAVSDLRNLVDADDADVRGEAVGALGLQGNAEDVRLLRLALDDVDGRVRVQAAKSIIQIDKRMQ